MLGQNQGFVREVRLLRERVPDFEQYPYNIPAIRSLDTLKLDARVTIFAGENGSGKSTLLEAIAVLAGFNPEGGTKNFAHAYQPTESQLFDHLKLIRGIKRERTGFFFRAEAMFNLFTEVQRNELDRHYGWALPHRMSHGESFLYVVAERFGRQGLFLMDEPESALSPMRQLALLRLIHDRVLTGSQFVIATHSPVLMAFPGARIFWLDAEGMHRRTLAEMDHFTVLRDFLNCPARTLETLFAEEASD